MRSHVSNSSPLRRMARRFLSDAQREQISYRIRPIERPILRLRTRWAVDLDALARLHGTDKSSSTHGYTRLYETHFASRRPTVRRLLEIGVGGIDSGRGYETTEGGQSLRMWRDYFPNAEIVGIDIHAKAVSGPRLRFEQGDQSDPVFLRALIENYRPGADTTHRVTGGPQDCAVALQRKKDPRRPKIDTGSSAWTSAFDIVIDDGSHIGSHITTSFVTLWSALTPGGIYVIEDLPLAYEASFEGGPPGTPGTAAELIKAAVDDTLLRFNDPFRPSIAAMHIYGGIAFFEKAK
jgi:hypothetical protein